MNNATTILKFVLAISFFSLEITANDPSIYDILIMCGGQNSLSDNICDPNSVLYSNQLVCAAYQYAIWSNSHKNRRDFMIQPHYLNFCRTSMDGYIQTLPWIRNATLMCNRSISENSESCSLDNAETKRERPPLITLLGTFPSTIAQVEAVGFGQLCIPVISSTASAASLDLNEYLVRTNPSDVYQARAIVQFLKKMNWTLVIILYQTSSYGEGLLQLFQNYSQNEGICIESMIPVAITYVSNGTKLWDDVHSATSRVLVLFMEADTAFWMNNLISWFRWFGNYQIVASDALYQFGPAFYDKSLEGVILFFPDNAVWESKFDEIVTTMNLNIIKEEYSRLTLLIDLIAEDNNCSLKTQGPGERCNGNETLMTYDATTLILSNFAIHAIERLYNSLDYLFKMYQTNEASSIKPPQFSGEDILSALKNCSISQSAQDSANMQSLGSGDLCVTPVFGIFQFYRKEMQSNIPRLHLVEVGNWSNNEGAFVDREKLKSMTNSSGYDLFDQIESQQKYCYHCNSSFITKNTNSCCVLCVKCNSKFEFVNAAENICTRCPYGFIPINHAATQVKGTRSQRSQQFEGIPAQCTSHEAVYQLIEHDELSVILIICFAIIGIMMSFLFSFIVVFNWKSPAVRVARPTVLIITITVSAAEFLLSLFAPLGLGHGFVYCLLSWPILGVGAVVNSCAVEAKLQLYQCIVNFSNRKSTIRHPSNKLLLSLSFGVICLEIFIIALVCVFNLPKPLLVADENLGKYFLTCTWFHCNEILTVFAFPLVLVLITGFHALRLFSVPVRMMSREVKGVIGWTAMTAMGNLLILPMLITLPKQQPEASTEIAVVFSAYMLFSGYVKLMTLVSPLCFVMMCRKSNNNSEWLFALKVPKLKAESGILQIRTEPLCSDENDIKF